MYMCKYMVKDQYELAASLSVIADARAHIEDYPSMAEDAGSSIRTAQHFLQRMLNASLAELAPTQAAAICLGMESSAHSHSFVNAYIWDAVRLVKVLNAGRELLVDGEDQGDDICELEEEGGAEELLPDLGGALLQATDDHQVTSYLDRPVLPALEVELRRRWPFDPGRITLLDGAQDALDRLIDATVNFGDRVIVETPTFPPVLDMLELAGAEVIGVPVDPEGPVVGAVEAALDRGPTVAIVQPRAHNPSGVAFSETRAAQLAARFAEHDVLVIEDDHSGMVAGAQLHSLGVHRPDRTVHVHSFSKSHGPDLRLAAVGGPSEIIDAVVRRRQLGPSWTSRLLQRILLGLLTDPVADAAVRDAEQTYLVRRRARSTTSATRSWRLRPAASAPRQADHSRSAMAAVTTPV